MRLDPRFLIIMIPLLTIGAVYLFWRILPETWRIGRVVMPVQLLAVLVGLLFAFQMPIGFAGRRTRLSRTSSRPAMCCMPPAWTTLVKSTARICICRICRPPAARALRRQMISACRTIRWLVCSLRCARSSFRFLIYDANAGPKYTRTWALLEPETHPAGLAPIYIQPDGTFAIYRLEDNRGPAPAQPWRSLSRALRCKISACRPAVPPRRRSTAATWACSALACRSASGLVVQSFRACRRRQRAVDCAR